MYVLSIAGSDPSSGAGIQGDIRTFNAMGVYGLTVLTAVTSQNTSRFFDVESVSPTLVRSQIRSILEDFRVDAIKIGMVYDKQTVRAISSELKDTKIPIIIDPIFKSTTGGILQINSAFSDFKKLLIPLSYVLTPNVLEAEKISNIKINSQKDLRNAARRIQNMGVKNVIIKGGHFVKSNQVTDLLLQGNRFYTFTHKRIQFESHGGGCTFSAALCASIARGKKLLDAVDFARLFTVKSMKNAVKAGRGLLIVKPHQEKDLEGILAHAILKFTSIRSIYKHIPECQTNFVYSNPNPSSLGDIMGLEGRIVRTGKSVTVAGQLKFGGSKHVAAAVLEITKKFPTIRAALNVKYDDIIIKKAITKGLIVSKYDRKKESREMREDEGNTIFWGIKVATNLMKTPPDIVFHTGDWGKEPMILIFGTKPTEILKKIIKII